MIRPSMMSPLAYKSLDSILENVKPTVDVTKRILPVFITSRQTND